MRVFIAGLPREVLKTSYKAELISDDTWMEMLKGGRLKPFYHISIPVDQKLRKFHLISGVLRKSGWVRYNPLSSSGVRGWFGSNPPEPFCSFRYLYSGCVFSPFTSNFGKKFKGNSKFCVAERCDLLGCSGAWFPN